MKSLDSRNRELDKKISTTELPDAVAILVSDAKKRKRQIRWLEAVVFVQLIIIAGLLYLSVQTHQLAAKAENNHTALIRSCETSNEARANNKQLWDYLFSLPSTQTPTTEQQVQIDKFKVFVAKTFAPRDCSLLK